MANTSNQEEKITHVEIEKIIPYELNSKIHDEESVNKLAHSIQEDGLNNPITVDKNMVVIGGHGRLLALKKLGRKIVPVIVKDNLTEKQVKTLRINDNRTVSDKYDAIMTKAELRAIDLSMEEIQRNLVIGFTENELIQLTSELDQIDTTALTADLDSDVVEQAKESERDIDKADLKLIPITNGLGFSKITVSDNRKVAKFIAKLQDEFDMDDPALAFLTFITNMEAA